jgi:hypothetical protein
MLPEEPDGDHEHPVNEHPVNEHPVTEHLFGESSKTQATLRSIGNANDRYTACVAIRDRLLTEQVTDQTMYSARVAEIEKVMGEECPEYLRWQQFTKMAQAGESARVRLAHISKVTQIWGLEVLLQHHSWGVEDDEYCKALSTAAIRFPDWKQASWRLDNIMARSGHPSTSANPITLQHLQELGKCVSPSIPSKSDFPCSDGVDPSGTIAMQHPVAHSPSSATSHPPSQSGHGIARTSPQIHQQAQDLSSVAPGSASITRPNVMSSLQADAPARSDPSLHLAGTKRRCSSQHRQFDSTVEGTSAPSDVEPRPQHLPLKDKSFRAIVLSQLAERRTPDLTASQSWGEHNIEGIMALLPKAHPPSTTGDEVEAYFATTAEAENLLKPGTVLRGPIITENQQQFQWRDTAARPIAQFFRRLGSRDRMISVQKSSLHQEYDSYVQMELCDLEAVFKKNELSDDPLNALDLRNPLPRCILPRFLSQAEDCQLLGRVRDEVLGGHTGERCTATISQWNQWKDDEDWVLLGQGGAQTLPHQDGCGKATWLTVQEGEVGFGWISQPSEQDMTNGIRDFNDQDRKIRYVVLRPGQTIYFEAGTIHFVFRRYDQQTLQVGGHVLRWSRVDSWIRLILNQLKNPSVTNEELLPAAPAYVEAVAHLLADQQRRDPADRLVATETVDEFNRLKEVCGLKRLNE